MGADVIVPVAVVSLVAAGGAGLLWAVSRSGKKSETSHGPSNQREAVTEAQTPQPQSQTQPVPGPSTTPSSPRIGVTAPSDGRLPNEVIDAIKQCGGTPVVLKNLLNRVEADLDRLDGIVFTGGPDVDPKHYGVTRRHKKTQPPDVARDAYELRAMKRAIEKDLAVLAICRGKDILNTVFHGTLHQHIPDLKHTTVNHRDWERRSVPLSEHTVTVKPDSLLAKLTKSTKFPTNATHHQAVKKIGKGLRSVARCDGLDEALELDETLKRKSAAWVVAPSWHPERIMNHRADGGRNLRIFQGFIAAARQTDQRRAAFRNPVREAPKVVRRVLRRPRAMAR